MFVSRFFLMAVASHHEVRIERLKDQRLGITDG
jgi:hypothetical protein